MLRQVSQAWFSVPFASYLLAPVHHKALDGIDPLRMRKDRFRIIKALVDEPYVQTADMMDYHGEMRPMNYIGSGYVAQVYSYMDTYSRCAESPPDRDAFLRKMVHRSLPMAKRSPSLFRYQLLPLARHLADVLPDPETHRISPQRLQPGNRDLDRILAGHRSSQASDAESRPRAPSRLLQMRRLQTGEPISPRPYPIQLRIPSWQRKAQPYRK